MSVLARHLADARAALVAGRAADCTAALAAFEAALDDHDTPDRRELQDCAGQLAALGRLSQAALSGISEARRQIAAAGTDARGLGIYHRDGQRDARAVLPRPGTRY